MMNEAINQRRKAHALTLKAGFLLLSLGLSILDTRESLHDIIELTLNFHGRDDGYFGNEFLLFLLDLHDLCKSTPE